VGKGGKQLEFAKKVKLSKGKRAGREYSPTEEETELEKGEN